MDDGSIPTSSIIIGSHKHVNVYVLMF
uniref:Uncharacterized protein n=1 Tax=Nelumbo nucifera TaxID=4432 RepID=A0A822YDT2_NELNU|nr:TPA_asm: hypothetical protein HUJ06_009373 [Nelumbo nucifera]